MIYTEHAPHPSLARHVECYWAVQGRVPAQRAATTNVLPDGCMDVIAAFGDPPRTEHGTGGAPYVVGTMTRPLRVRYAGAVDTLGVRFRPGGIGAYVRVDAAELTDRTADLACFWGPSAADLFDRLADAGTLAERVRVLDRTLLTRAGTSRCRLDEAVLRASAVATGGSSGSGIVDEMAGAAGLGRRQLERRFLAGVGVPPKTISRIARFRRAVELLHAEPAMKLSILAARAGYADQPHLTRDFVALAGISPARYRRERAGA
jgi:AraC-like DNA-binding protein